MKQFSATDESFHDGLAISIEAKLTSNQDRFQEIEEDISQVGIKCSEMLKNYSYYDELVDNVAAAVTAKSQARHKLRLSRKFLMNPMRGSQIKFTKLIDEAEAFLKLSQHHLTNAEELVPSSFMKM